MSAMQGDRSSDEIRRDIERTRADMDETVDALESRLSPGQLLDQVWGSVKGGGGGIGDVVRDHPVPLALMGLGVAWLAVEKTGNSHDGDAGPGTWARAEGRRGPYRGNAVQHGDPDWEHAGTGDKLKAKAKDAAESVKDAARSAKEKAADAASSARESTPDAGSLRDRAGDTLDDARHAAARKARQAQGTFERILHDQPLAMGAVSFGLGLAAGLAAPTTEWEDRAMGETADTLKHEVKETALETGEKAARVARDAASAAQDEAERQHMGDALSDKARRVASVAKEAAEDRADRENLDAESLKDRGREAAEKTKDQARRGMS